ncbi:MAG: TonB-dependent receptor plug domain-containing protein [Xanthomonadales bacterium]|nr:TonB-dependent receptor plug domain-containing protein [Xanthomonadales bacterium]
MMPGTAAPGMLEEVIVSGTRVEGGIRMGASTIIDTEQINETATIGRDFKNVIRLDPRVSLDPANQNAISIGGFNARLNSLTVDGVRQNDEFGLNQSGFPTQRTPVSMDAIEQISVESAPFGVEFGGFQGGTVNIVTKSGDNEFHGGAFYFWTDDGFIGDKSEDQDINIGEFEEEFIGGTFSGPIIKDKLWFFVSYEKFEASDPAAIEYGVEGSGRAREIEGITQADVDMIRQITLDVYDFDPLPLFENAIPVEDEKWLAKIDWQINDKHNATFTYQDVVGNALVNQGNSQSSQRLSLPSNFYARGEDMQALSVQLFSRWTDAFSTEVKFATKDIENLQAPLGGMEFALMEIKLDADREIRLGPDFFRHANFLFTDNTQFKLKGDYAWGNHLFTAGYEFDEVDVFNIFAPGSLGDYDFDSVEDYINQRASNLSLSNISATGNVDDLGGKFTNAIHSFYIQDRWDFRDNLVLQAGIRVDSYSSNDAPVANQSFLARNGFDNSETLDGRSVVMPRFGFNWTLTDRTTIRGGAGLFSGGVPIGFLSNSFSNVGILNQDGRFSGDDLADIKVDGYNIDPSLLDQLSPGDGNVAAVDPNFDIPSTWKFNLAVDQLFDIGASEGYRFSADLILAYVKDAPTWIDLRRQVIGNAADGRPIYGAVGCVADDPFTSDCRKIPNWDILMTNTGKGQNHSLALSLDKLFDWGRGGMFNTYVSYTYQDITAVNDALSSTPTSLMGREQTSDRNNTLEGQSSFETTNRFVASLTWRKDFMENLTTSVNLFFSSQTGKTYGYTFDAPRTSFGDTFGGNEPIDDDDTQLLYVPTGLSDPNVIFAPGFDYAAFDAMVEGESCLKKFRGKIAKKNSCNSPTYSRLDMRFTQEIRLPDIRWVGNSNLQFIIDIENLGNLLNDDWGRYEQIGFPFTKQTVTLDGDLGPDGELIFNSFRDENFSVSGLPSLWKVQFGLRYNF